MVSDIKLEKRNNKYLLLGKAVLRLICELTHPEKSIGDYSMDVAECMNSAAEVTTMVDKWIREASD